MRHDPLIKAIADETLRKLPQFSPQGLVNTLWGFATLVIKGEAGECGQNRYKKIIYIYNMIRNVRFKPGVLGQVVLAAHQRFTGRDYQAAP